MINTLMFDLDGTLLNMDIELFTKIYFNEMGKAFNGIIEKERLIQSVWTATKEMIHNTDNISNRNVFMEKFKTLIDDDLDLYIEKFDQFYKEGFLKTKKAVKKKDLVTETICLLKDKGYSLILATNPLFPQQAIYQRILWAGLEPELFSYISTYENSSYCKPQIKYYRELLEINSKSPEECLMVGNDVEEDMIAGQIGLSTYLVDDHIISRTDKIQCDQRGSFPDFQIFSESLPSVPEK